VLHLIRINLTPSRSPPTPLADPLAPRALPPRIEGHPGRRRGPQRRPFFRLPPRHFGV